MAKSDKKDFSNLNTIVDWDLLVISLFSFSLGITFVFRTGKQVSWMASLNALSCIIFVLIGYFLVKKYVPKQEVIQNDKKKQNKYLISSFVSLSLSLLNYAIWIISTDRFHLSSLVFLILMISVVLCYALEFANIGIKGLKELGMAFLTSVLIPGFSYSYYGERFSLEFIGIFLSMSLLILSHFIIRRLKFYDPQKDSRGLNFLDIVGWKKGLQLHHVILLCGYLFALVFSLIISGWYAFWPLFTSLPFAISVIVLSLGIEQGKKPNWKVLHAVSLATVTVSLYMLTITYLFRWIS